MRQGRIGLGRKEGREGYTVEIDFLGRKEGRIIRKKGIKEGRKVLSLIKGGAFLDAVCVDVYS